MNQGQVVSNKKDKTPDCADFEAIEHLGKALLARMAEGVTEEQFRSLLKVSLDMLKSMRSLDSVTCLLKPENVLPQSGMLTREQVKNFFLHLSSLSRKLSEEKSDYSKTGKILLGEAPEVVPARKSEAEIAEQFFAQAKLEYQNNNFWRAKELAEAAIHRNSNSGKYHLVHGLSCAHHPSFRRDAEKSLQAAIEVEPWDPEYRIALATFYQKNGLLLRAMRECQQADEVAPGNLRIQHLMHELKMKTAV